MMNQEAQSSSGMKKERSTRRGSYTENLVCFGEHNFPSGKFDLYPNKTFVGFLVAKYY